MKYQISSYTTTRNVSEMNYPFKESIISLLNFSQEVIVVDTSDNRDDTLNILKDMSDQDNRIKIYHFNLDWNEPNSGRYDGEMKALARSFCTSEFLWQNDIDEIIHEDHIELIDSSIDRLKNSGAPLMALPVVEYWGSSGVIRLDVNSWKWRLSKNHPDITHGMPKHLRKYINGLLFAEHGTDGCDYISKNDFSQIPCLHYITEEYENTRNVAYRTGNFEYLEIMKLMIDNILSNMPATFHYSWFNIERKIVNYKQFWTKFWPSLYGESLDERNNPFFPGLLWEEVTPEMIKLKAKELESGTVGHIFHSPWNGNKKYGVHIDMKHPKIMEEWIKENSL